MIQLRHYQQAMIDQLDEKLRQGKKRLLMCSAAGSGKTETMGAMIQRSVKHNFPVLFVVRRRELVKNASRRFTKNGIDHSVFMAGNWKFDPKKLVQVCSIDTLRARKSYPFNEGGCLVIIDECFSGDTEILTENGFVRFDELSNEKVAQLSTDDLKIDFVAPIRKIEKAPTSKVLSIKSDKKIDLLVTEEHDMISRSMKGRWEKKKAKELTISSTTFVPTSGFANGHDNKLTCYEKLLIAYQADGSHHKTNKNGTFVASFQFSKQRKIDAFLKLMKDGSFIFNEVKPSVFKNPNIKEKRRFMVRLNHSIKKEIYEYFDIKTLGLEKCKDIIEYMNIWDGNVAYSDMYVYTSTNKKCSDFYQSIAVMCGYNARIKHTVDNRSEKFNDTYRLFISKRKGEITTSGITRKEVEYKGNVFCVQVPKGNIIVRRNGKTLVTGNCHLNYEEIFENYPKAFIIGGTGTPFTKHVERYEDFVQTIEPYELRDQGYLVRDRFFVPHIIDVSAVKMRAGDFDQKQLESIVTNSAVVGDIVQDWIDLGQNRPTVCFATSVNHSLQLKHAFLDKGIIAVHIDAKSTEEERDRAKTGLEDGSIQIVCNVDIFSTGWDCPIVSCIIFARPTWSLAWFIQAASRGLRSFPGKEDCIFLDNAGNIFRHGSPFRIREISLAPKDKKTKKEYDTKITSCPECYFIYDPTIHRSCPDCGHVKEAKERRVNTIDGKLIEYEEHQDDTAKRRKTMIVNKYRELEWGRKKGNMRPEWTFIQLRKNFSREEMVHLKEVTMVPERFLPLPN